jgi:type II secretory pathway component PulK
MKHRAQGMALIYVIVLMSLISVYLMEILSNTRIMLRQTRRAELVAINRNLQASASAWARAQPASMPPQRTTLDASTLSKRQASITLTGQDHAILIETACTLAAQSHKQTRKIQFLP